MRSFLINSEGKPVCKWGLIPPGIMFVYPVPENYKLAISPGKNKIVIDVDVNHKNGLNGFDSIPEYILEELEQTYNYKTKSGGRHYWFTYFGNPLKNKAGKLGVDLRYEDRGYVVYYPANQGIDIKDHIHLIKESSPELNIWLESLFA